jgi:pimeloyl-ACP methyl ester carboxylesterase
MITQTDAGAPATWRRSTVTLPGGERVAVFEAGREEAAAPALLLVHGLGHWTQAAWDALVPRFASTHRIVALDLPGFGASDKPDVAYTLTYFTAALAHVVAAHLPERFALAGHSFGGLIAANYAASSSERIRALALLDPAGFVRTPKIALRVAGSRPIAWLLRNVKPSAGFIDGTLDQSVYDPTSVGPAVRARAVALARDPAYTRAFARVYSGAMQELLHMRALHRSFTRYAGPVVLIWGKDDRYVPFAGLTAARTVYPQAAVLAIDRCGHCPAIEYPELVARALRSVNV